jgi:hypothetical protein
VSSPPEREKPTPPQDRPSHKKTNTTASHTNIAPDIVCPRCGPCIVCPHTMFYASIIGGTFTANDDRSFRQRLEDRDRREAAERGRSYDPDAIHEWLGTKPPGGKAFSDDWSDYFDKVHARPRPSAPPRPADIAQPGTNPAYVAAAIRDELDRLASTDEGARNHTLNQVAFAVFGFVKARHADKAAAHAELVRVAEEIGLGTREIHATLRSAWTSASPRDVPAPRGAA